MTMGTLTPEQEKTFRNILDLNWEFENEKDWGKKWALAKSLGHEKKTLKESMGEANYNRFIETGRQMFAEAN